MSPRKRDDYNGYMREYMAARYERRKAKAIAMLGGKCRCGTTEGLEFDHIVPSTKAFTIGKALAGMAWAKLVPEILKCQLLCKSCHGKKTLGDAGKTSAKGVHGTLSSYRYCRCQTCRDAASAAQRIRQEKKTGRMPKARPRTAQRRHGTHSRYCAGCRCVACRDSHAQAMRDWRAKNGR